MERRNNPWMALGTYEEHHEDRFKGREKDTEIMLTMLRQNECVVCYAASGEGKSSLINAGLCPKIRREGMFPIKIVFTTDDFEGKGIPFIEGKNHIDFDKLLLNKIEHCIKEYETNFKKTHNIKEAFHIEFEKKDKKYEEYEYSRFSKNSLWWKLRTEIIKVPFGEFDYIPVLIFDQFEEVFRSPWVKEFFNWLEELMKDVCPDYIAEAFSGELNELPYNKLFKSFFSLRYEYVGELDYWCSQRSFIPQLIQNRYFLKPLTKSNAKEVITCQPDYDGLNSITDILIRYLSHETDQNPIDESEPCISPLFLSVICSSIYDMAPESRDKFIASLENDGDIEKDKESSLNGILKEFYEKSLRNAVYDYDINSVKDVLENVLLDSNGLRNRLSIDDERIKHTPFRRYLRSLEKARLIRTIPVHSNNRTTIYVELVHDCLCPILMDESRRRRRQKNWKRLRNIIILLSAFLIIVWNLFRLNGGEKGDVISSIEGNPIKYVHDMSLSTIKNDTLYISKSEVRRNAFRGNSSIKVLVVGDSVTINPFSFAECPNLAELRLVGRGISIGLGAFSNCTNLKSIFVSASCSVENMDYQVNMPGLQKVVIEDGNNHFYSCGRTTIVRDRLQEFPIDKSIRARIRSNGKYTLYGTVNAPANSQLVNNLYLDSVVTVKNILIDSLNKELKQKGNERIALNGQIDENWDGNTGLEKIKKRIVDLRVSNVLVLWPLKYRSLLDSCLLSLNINDSIKSSLLSHMICNDFIDCSIERIDLPDLEYVGPLVFANNKMSFVDLPKAKWIKQKAFAQCRFLSDVNLPTAVLLDGQSFALCTSLDEIHAPNVKIVNDQCFILCDNLKTINLPNVRKVGDNAFYGCSQLATVYLPSVETLGEDVFGKCLALQNIIVPRAVADVILEHADYYGLNQLYVKSRRGSLTTLSTVRDYQRIEQSVFNVDSCNSWLKELYVSKNTESLNGGWDADGFCLKWLEDIKMSFFNQQMFHWRNNILTDEGDLLACAQNNKILYVPYTDSIISLGKDVEKVYLLNAASLWNLLPNDNPESLPRVYLPYGSEGIANKYYSNGIFETVESLGFLPTLYYRVEFATKALFHKIFIHKGISGILVFLGLVVGLLLIAFLLYLFFDAQNWNKTQCFFFMLLYIVFCVLVWASLMSSNHYNYVDMGWGVLLSWLSLIALPTMLYDKNRRILFLIFLLGVAFYIVPMFFHYSSHEEFIIMYAIMLTIMSFVQKKVFVLYCQKSGTEPLKMGYYSRWMYYVIALLCNCYCYGLLEIQNNWVRHFISISFSVLLMSILLVVVVRYLDKLGKLRLISVGVEESDD